MPEELPLAELLERWAAEVRDHAREGRGQVPPWPVRPGATQAQLAAADQRLGMSLPPSYRQFLALSDGWAATGHFVASLRPVEQIGWFRDLERDWYETWREVDIDGVWSEGDDDGWPLMARALLVSGPGEDALLLDPARIDPQTGEWHCCTLSNATTGAGGGESFGQGLRQLYETFVALHVPASPTRDSIETGVEAAYRRALAGDLAALDGLAMARQVSWRARALLIQWDAAAPQSRTEVRTTMHLWWGTPDMPAETALQDAVLLEELVPLWVATMIDNREDVSYEISRAPDVVAALMRRHLTEIEQQGGITADFGYSPPLEAAAALARAAMPDDPRAAWQHILDALPRWQPRAPHHLLPAGLLYDRDLSPLFTGHGGPLAGQQPDSSYRSLIVTDAATGELSVLSEGPDERRPRARALIETPRGLTA
jgi:hypothetical protein